MNASTFRKSQARPRQAFGCTGFTSIRKRHRPSRKRASHMTQRLAITKRSDTAREPLKSSSTLDVDRLLELPLHIMDTALFYPSYMNLSDDEARAAMLPLIENVTRFGGVLTINWHDRSLGPERLWADAYVTLLRDLRARTPWFATALQTVSWFRKRRATSFASITQDGGSVRVQTATDPTAADLPPLTLRVYNSGASRHNLRSERNAVFEDFTIDGSDEVLIAA